MTWLNSLNRTSLALGSVVAAAILLLAVNLFSAEMFRGDRLDLTEGKLFTIADGTKSLLKKIDEPIEVNLYFSQKNSCKSLFFEGENVKIALMCNGWAG